MVLSHQSQGTAEADLLSMGSIAVTGLAAATAGDLVCIMVQWGKSSFAYNPIPAAIGWPNGSFAEVDRETTTYDAGSGVGGYTTVAYGYAVGGETSWAVATNEVIGYQAVTMVVDVFRGMTAVGVTYTHLKGTTGAYTIPSVTPTASAQAIVWAGIAVAPNVTPASISAGWTLGSEFNGGYRQTIKSAYRLEASASGSYGGTLSSPDGGNGWIIYTVAFDDAAAPTPTADFSATPLVGSAPLTVDFTDLTTPLADSWAWDFGDGDTSTDRNPTHIYLTAGTYTVELVATIGANSDTETKVAYIVVTDAAPGGVLDPTAADPVPITDDIVEWTIRRGAAEQVTGAAPVGSATVKLRNTDNKYNPENGSSPLIAYLRDGTAIHIAINKTDGLLTGASPAGLFGGRITDITPSPMGGQATPPFVEFQCEDALGWMSRTPVTLAYATGRAQRQIRVDILDAIDEARRDLDNEIQTVPLSGGEGNALSLLEDLNKANGTRHFVRPATAAVDWYQYVTFNRQRGLDGASDASLAGTDILVSGIAGWRLSADTVVNQQKASITPIRFTPSTYTVWQSPTLPITVTATRPLEVWVEFDDYVAAPALNTAYSGAAPTFALTPFGTTAKLTITVASGSCVFTSLSIEGALARRLPTQSWVEDDLTSQVLPRGIRSGSDISNEYVGTLSTARGIAQHVVWRYATPLTRPTLTIANWFPEMFDLDLGDIITVTFAAMGVTAQRFEIVGLTHRGIFIKGAISSLHTVEYVLQKSRVQDAADFPWFYLDDDPGSLLDDADKMLAY